MEFLNRYKCAKILYVHKSLFISQLDILKLVVVKQKVEALHRSYFNYLYIAFATFFSTF